MINYIILLYSLSFVIYYGFIWRKSIKRNKEITENNMVFLNKWGNVCLAYNWVFSSVVLSFIFIEKSLVMPIFLVFLGAYYLFLMTWYCVKLRKRKLFIYTLRVTGFLLLVIGIILGVITFIDEDIK